jgi:Sulfotransferase domain
VALSRLRANRRVRWLLQRQQLPHLGPRDCLVQSYPRSGSTWFRFVLGGMISGSTPDFDSAEQHFTDLPSRYWAGPPKGSVRYYRTHDPLFIDPSLVKCKVITLVRNPVDTLPSYWEYRRALNLDGYDLETFVHSAISGRLPDAYGSWPSNVQSWSRAQTRLCVQYEHLLANPLRAFSRTAEYLGLEIASDQIVAAIDGADRVKMRAAESTARRLRRFEGSFVSLSPRDGRQQMEPRLVEYIQAACKPELVKLGYQL